MSIVHLGKRVTVDPDEYNKYLRSNDSLIYVKEPLKTDESGPDCLSLTVGSCWYDNARYVEVPQKGLKIKSQSSVVIETAEEIALPYNMYGLLFGAGSNIYRGTFISSGKIDPGFAGKLRVGFHNGSDKTVILKQGDKLAYAIFVRTECDLEHTPIPRASDPPVLPALSRRERAWRWIKQNGFQIVPIVLSLLSVIAAVATVVIDLTKQ